MFSAVRGELERLNEAEMAARFGEARVHAPRQSDPMPQAEPQFDALLPAEMAVRAESVGVRKSGLDSLRLFALAVLAETIHLESGMRYQPFTTTCCGDKGPRHRILWSSPNRTLVSPCAVPPPGGEVTNPVTYVTLRSAGQETIADRVTSSHFWLESRSRSEHAVPIRLSMKVG